MKTLHGFLILLSAGALAACPPPGRGPGPIIVEPPPDDQRPPPTGPAFDAKGWVLLGSQTVDGKVDRDVIAVGKQEGRFDKLTMVVVDSDLDLLDFVVTFGNGTKFEPKIKFTFREGTRSRAIDLPGDDRFIKSIEIVYANIPGGGRARVEVYGKDAKPRPPKVDEPPPPPPAEPAFDSKGWALLGSQTVEGKKDKDVIKVGKKAGKLDKITLVVTDSDLELADFIVTFGNGTKFEPKIKHVFKEGTRSRAIDLPGDDRFIKSIELHYGNLPGGGKAKVEIWGKDSKAKPKP